MDGHGAMIVLHLGADLTHELDHGADLRRNSKIRPGREVVLDHLTRITHLCGLGENIKGKTRAASCHTGHGSDSDSGRTLPLQAIQVLYYKFVQQLDFFLDALTYVQHSQTL